MRDELGEQQLFRATPVVSERDACGGGFGEEGMDGEGCRRRIESEEPGNSARDYREIYMREMGISGWRTFRFTCLALNCEAVLLL